MASEHAQGHAAERSSIIRKTWSEVRRLSTPHCDVSRRAGSTGRGAARLAPSAVNFPARLRLEPLFLAGNVDSLEFFIGLGQVDNPFHQPKYASSHQSDIANHVHQ